MQQHLSRPSLSPVSPQELDCEPSVTDTEFFGGPPPYFITRVRAVQYEDTLAPCCSKYERNPFRASPNNPKPKSSPNRFHFNRPQTMARIASPFRIKSPRFHDMVQHRRDCKTPSRQSEIPRFDAIPCSRMDHIKPLPSVSVDNTTFLAEINESSVCNMKTKETQRNTNRKSKRKLFVRKYRNRNQHKDVMSYEVLEDIMLGT
eukprot:195979_1